MAAIERGEIDAIANVDPVIAKLEASGKVVVMADTRTTEGSDKVFGGGRLSEARFPRGQSQDGASAGQCLLPGAAMDAEGEPGADRRQRAAGVLARDKALHLAALKADLHVYSHDGVVARTIPRVR